MFPAKQDFTTDHISRHTIDPGWMELGLKGVVRMATLSLLILIKSGGIDTSLGQTVFNDVHVFNIELAPPERWIDGGEIVGEARPVVFHNPENTNVGNRGVPNLFCALEDVPLAFHIAPGIAVGVSDAVPLSGATI